MLRDRVPPRPRDLRDDVVGRAAPARVDLAVAVVDDDADAPPGEVEGERAAEPLAAAGDDGDLVTPFARVGLRVRHESSASRHLFFPRLLC